MFVRMIGDDLSECFLVRMKGSPEEELRNQQLLQFFSTQQRIKPTLNAVDTGNTENTDGILSSVSTASTASMPSSTVHSASMPSLAPSSVESLSSPSTNNNFSSDVKLQRYRQVFTDKFREFREVVALALGYQVDLCPDGKTIRLTSLFTSDPKRDFLELSKEDSTSGVGSSLFLKNGPFMRQFEREYEIYVRVGNSLPSFLSAITISLWERQTIHSK